MRHSWMVLVAAVSATSCATYQPTPTSDVFEGRSWTNALADLEKKAEFDLECDGASLTYRKLGPGSVGVEGCGQRVRYEQTYGGKWVADIVKPVAPE